VPSPREERLTYGGRRGLWEERAGGGNRPSEPTDIHSPGGGCHMHGTEARGIRTLGAKRGTGGTGSSGASEHQGEVK